MAEHAHTTPAATATNIIPFQRPQQLAKPHPRRILTPEDRVRAERLMSDLRAMWGLDPESTGQGAGA